MPPALHARPEHPATAAAPTGHRAFSRALLGMDAPAVTVETHLPGGLPSFTLVGLPETAVREARDRVRSAIQNCGLDFPAGRVVVNLAPADLVKEGARYDLAIAISILCATGQVPAERARAFEFLGELGLFGELRAVRGALCAVLALQLDGSTRQLVIPAPNGAEASTGAGRPPVTARHLREVGELLVNDRTPPAQERPRLFPSAQTVSLSDVIGQSAAKRALVVSAAGGHHLLFVGPPGTGKTMLAHRLARLLPRLGEAEELEVAAIHSAAGVAPPPPGVAPFREPHHSASTAAIAGGGPQAMPGEISLAHAGVLFLDELPHFRPSVLDLLREPLESRAITLARARYRTRFPARFQLVAAMNPCPAGRICTPPACRCSPDSVRRYQARISGPLLDRIDLHVAVPEIPAAALLNDDGSTAPVIGIHAIEDARQRQINRQGMLNAELGAPALRTVAQLPADARRLLAQAVERFRLSARSAHRVLRTSRTIADIAGSPGVQREHLVEALGYRGIDWERGAGGGA
ncbi:MAG: YifB family Mg chelatase-like AAA ATPase [Pseudomonadales bacterium]